MNKKKVLASLAVALLGVIMIPPRVAASPPGALPAGQPAEAGAASDPKSGRGNSNGSQAPAEGDIEKLCDAAGEASTRVNALLALEKVVPAQLFTHVRFLTTSTDPITQAEALDGLFALGPVARPTRGLVMKLVRKSGERAKVDDFDSQHLLSRGLETLAAIAPEHPDTPSALGSYLRFTLKTPKDLQAEFGPASNCPTVRAAALRGLESVARAAPGQQPAVAKLLIPILAEASPPVPVTQICAALVACEESAEPAMDPLKKLRFSGTPESQQAVDRTIKAINDHITATRELSGLGPNATGVDYCRLIGKSPNPLVILKATRRLPTPDLASFALELQTYRQMFTKPATLNMEQSLRAIATTFANVKSPSMHKELWTALIVDHIQDVYPAVAESRNRNLSYNTKLTDTQPATFCALARVVPPNSNDAQSLLTSYINEMIRSDNKGEALRTRIAEPLAALENPLAVLPKKKKWLDDPEPRLLLSENDLDLCKAILAAHPKYTKEIADLLNEALFRESFTWRHFDLENGPDPWVEKAIEILVACGDDGAAVVNSYQPFKVDSGSYYTRTVPTRQNRVLTGVKEKLNKK